MAETEMKKALSEPWKGTFSQRLVQYACLGGFVISLKVLRASIPSFVPIIGREFGCEQPRQQTPPQMASNVQFSEVDCVLCGHRLLGRAGLLAVGEHASTPPPPQLDV